VLCERFVAGALWVASNFARLVYDPEVERALAGLVEVGQPFDALEADDVPGARRNGFLEQLVDALLFGGQRFYALLERAFGAVGRAKALPPTVRQKG